MDDLLIDFDTPRAAREQYLSKQPLIPCPVVPSALPESNNPFDFLAKAAEDGPSDPFDFPSPRNTNQTPKIKTDVAEDFKKNKGGTTPVGSFSPEQRTPDNFVMDSVEEIVQNDSQKTEDGLFDIELNITRDVIAKRVNSCIQKALNQSMQDIREPVPPNHTKVRRSISAAGLGHDVPYSSPERRSKGILNNTAPERPKLNDSIFEASKDIIFREARKISQSFKKIASSFTQKASDDDDLFSLKPEWDCPDLDEEDEVGLPVLNRSFCRNTLAESPKTGVSDVMKRFKKLRRSLDTSDIAEPMKIEEKREIKRCHSVGYLEEKQTVEEKDILPKPQAPQIQPPALLPDNHPGKLKIKKSLQDAKGPLKALVPLRKMTKKINDKIISPLRSACSPSNKHEVLKDGSFVASVPVASSTPSRVPSAGRTPLSSRLSRRESGPPSRLRSSSVVGTTKTLNTSVEAKTAGLRGRPRSAPSQKPRALTEIPQSTPRNIMPPKHLLPSKLGRTGRGSLSGKENQIMS